MFKKFLIIITLSFLYTKSFSDVNTDKIINYLNNCSTLQSKFIQVNQNGDVLTGRISLLRPGKFRIEYDQISLLIISDGRKVAVINKDIKNISFYSLNDLPSSILLFKDISLNLINILKFNDKDNVIEIHFEPKVEEQSDMIVIAFEKKPLIMKKWTILRKDNTKTTITFTDLLLNTKINNVSFDIDKDDPRHGIWRD